MSDRIVDEELSEGPDFSSGYPPLPPNCPFFTDHDCFGPCFHIWNGYCDGVSEGPTSQYFILSSMDDPKVSYMKPIIAATARCAWNDTLRVKPGEGIRKTPSDVELTYRNSEAWRLWSLKSTTQGSP